ncbi:hypothetical protein [Sphingomonas phage Kharn]|uniref:Uncharacterized protein n=1 Tax=Sphingomonas phage Kharn TaxID=2686312 RepID=A0A6M3TA04_9CAUD|nr:hypothetical protein P9A29_gp31 [Sphingomonas phage Kharn]QJD54533.1 hypothetical protein [Sphingomonas phage Kharn]
MSWGNPAAATAAPVAVKCDHPDCSKNAVVIIEVLAPAMSDSEMMKVNSCADHAIGQTIVGLVEGSKEPIDERIVKQLVAQHDTAKEVLERAKNSEMEARLMVGNYAFPLAGRKEGVNNLELGDGRTVKLGHKVNYKLSGDNEAVEKAEDECDAIGNEGSFLRERIITWEAKFSKSEYNKLDTSNPTHAKVKAAIDKVLEISNGTPSLEVKEPKAKLNNQ